MKEGDIIGRLREEIVAETYFIILEILPVILRTAIYGVYATYDESA
ncbi:MAG: hypothetical protein IPI22_15695 [Bacteroidetes bacterium]|nr:hypothetical protein [Bacteroidota bacterium]